VRLMCSDYELRERCVDVWRQGRAGDDAQAIAAVRALFPSVQPEGMSVRLEIASRILAGVASAPSGYNTGLSGNDKRDATTALELADALIALERETRKK